MFGPNFILMLLMFGGEFINTMLTLNSNNIYMCVFKHVLTKVVKLQVAILHHKSCVQRPSGVL